MTATSSNSLFAFNKFTAARALKEIPKAIHKHSKKLAQLLKTPANWQDLQNWQQQLSEDLESWEVLLHLMEIQDCPEYREAYETLQPQLTSFFSQIERNQAYFDYQILIAKNTKSAQKKRVIKLATRDFPRKKNKFEELEKLDKALQKTQHNFQKNILDSSQSWSLQLKGKEDLAGVPQHLQEIFKNDQGAYEVKLRDDHVVCFLSHAENRELRKLVHQAYASRASDQFPQGAEFDNARNIEKILEYRQEKAQLLKYHNYAELSLEKKMAQSPHQAIDFLQQLAGLSAAKAEEDFALLRDQATKLGIEDFSAPDVGFVQNKLEKDYCQFDREQLRSLFPLEKVLSGLQKFTFAHFGIKFVELRDHKLWHEDAKKFALMKSGKAIGYLYTDLYARANKRGGAWVFPFRSRNQLENGYNQLPEAFLVGNFLPPPSPGLNHQELVTLFHEFGHALHHLTTTIKISDISGLNNVEWDAVEIPSQLLERWCWNEEVLSWLSGGQKIPEDVYHQPAQNPQLYARQIPPKTIAFWPLRSQHSQC